MAKLNLEVTSTGIRKTEKEIKSLDKEVIGLTKTNIELNKSLQSLDKTSKTYAKDKDNLTKAIKRNNLAQKEARNNMRSLNFESRNAISGINNLKGGFIALGAVIATLGIKNLITDLVSVGVRLEAMQVSLDASVGSAIQGGKAFDFLVKQSDYLGVSLLASTQGFKELSASAKGTAISGTEVRDIFKSVTEAGAVMQLTTDDLNGTFRALSQIMSKGTVQAEELRGQLGERIPGAFQIASRAMNVTTQELGKMLEQGEVIADDFLPKFAKELDKTFNGDVPKAIETTSASFRRFENQILLFKKAIADSGLNDLAGTFAEISSEILKGARKVIDASRIYNGQLEALKTLEEVAKRRLKIISEINRVAEQFGDNRNSSAKKAFENRVKSLQQELNNLNKIGATIAQKEEKDRLEQEKKDQIAQDKKQQSREIAEQKRQKAIKATQDKEAKAEEKRLNDIFKTQTNSLTMWQKYYQEIGDMDTSWQLQRVMLQEQYSELTADQFEKLAQKVKSQYYDQLKKEQDKLKLDDFSFNIQADPFEGWGSSLNGLVSTMGDLGDEQKTFTKFTQDYNKIVNKTDKDKEKFAKGESKHQSNLIKGYSNIAGSLGGLFKEGSDGAKAMMITQSALATVNAVNAVLTQGQGDPYTSFARMATMSTAVAGLLSSIGLAFSGTSGSDSSFTTNTGTGTVLGDEEAQSESIANSLSLLEDLARPEFKLLSEMNASLKSIDAKTQNLARGILQAGGFAMGEGFEGFEKQNLQLNQDVANAIMTGGIGLILGRLKIPIISDIANLFGGVLNSVLGGLFGKTSVSLKDAGIQFGNQNILDAIENLQGQSYQRIKIRKKSWFGSSTKYKNRYQALDEDVERQFSLVLKDIYDVVQTGGEALKVPADELQKNLDSFTVSLGRISLKGKTGEQIQETLTAIFGKVGDQLARQAIPIIDEFQKVGEGTLETLTRVATGMQEANFFIEKLGNTFQEVNYQDLLEKQGNVGLEALRQSILKFEKATFGATNGVLKIIETLQSSTEEMFNTYQTLDDLRSRIKFFGHDIQGLTTSMLFGAGGIDKLKEGFDVYFDKFLSESEQQEFRIKSMTDQFKKLGLELPESRDAFKELLRSIDLTTEEGQKLYGSMLNLADGFADATEAQEKYNKAMAKTREDTQKVIDELTGTSSSGGNTFSQLSQLNRLKTEYGKTKDVNTFNEILSLSRSLGKDDRFTDSIVGFLRNSLDTFATPALSQSSVNTPYVVPTTSQTPTTSNVQSTLTQSATSTQQAINLNAGYTAEMLTQITELNQKFKEVTNGGNAMRSELVAI